MRTTIPSPIKRRVRISKLPSNQLCPPKRTKGTARVATLKLSEHEIQASYFKMVRLQWPGCKTIYAIPNAAKRSPRLAAMMKAEGLTSGIPDVNIDHQRGSFIGMRIEFKKPGNTTTCEQDDAIAQLRDCGYLVLVHTDAEAAFNDTKDYLSGNHYRFIKSR